MSKARDEFEHILDTMHIEFRTPEELAEAADKATATIYEACSDKHVPIADYKATREKCIRSIMEELGRPHMFNDIFNDIMDVVAISQMANVIPKQTFTMQDTRAVITGGSSVGAYFDPRRRINLAIISDLYDYIMGNMQSYEFTVYGGDMTLATAADRTWLRGTIIHEMGHFAMYAVFKNNCDPYFGAYDEKKFSVIVKQTMDNLYVHFLGKAPGDLTIEEMGEALKDRMPNGLEVFSRMFRGGYPPDQYNREFVVRLPEIFAAHYINEYLPPKLLACFEPLASYWKDAITPQLRRFIDLHKKGHLVNTDRVHEPNALAHSGEHYLMLEGKETPAGIQAQALISAINGNNVVDFTKILEASLDDRLPRLALAQAVEHNRPAMFEAALKKIQHPQYLGHLLGEVMKHNKHQMFEVALLKKISHTPRALIPILNKAIEMERPDMVKLIIPGIIGLHLNEAVKVIQEFVNDAITTGRFERIEKVLPLLADEERWISQLIGKAMAQAKEGFSTVTEEKFLAVLLPYASPLFLYSTFREALESENYERFEQILPFMVRESGIMNGILDTALWSTKLNGRERFMVDIINAVPVLLEHLDQGLINKILAFGKKDAQLFVTLMTKGADNPELITALNKVLPDMLMNSELKQQIIDAAMKVKNRELLDRIVGGQEASILMDYDKVSSMPVSSLAHSDHTVMLGSGFIPESGQIKGTALEENNLKQLGAISETHEVSSDMSSARLPSVPDAVTQAQLGLAAFKVAQNAYLGVKDFVTKNFGAKASRADFMATKKALKSDLRKIAKAHDKIHKPLHELCQAKRDEVNQHGAPRVEYDAIKALDDARFEIGWELNKTKEEIDKLGSNVTVGYLKSLKARVDHLNESMQAVDNGSKQYIEEQVPTRMPVSHRVRQRSREEDNPTPGHDRV